MEQVKQNLIAISNNGTTAGTGLTTVTVNQGLDVLGLGALARGDKATVTIKTTNNTIITGENGGLVSVAGGTINFGGGTITHSLADKVAFYAEKDSAFTSKIDFAGATTLNISDGIVFYGDKTDY